MSFELDHVLVCVRTDAPEAELLDQWGLVRGRGRSHPGQGTRNERYFFRNAHLELIWLDDPAEVQSPAIRPTGLWERCRWRQTGACPFGIALRPVAPGSGRAPFDAWDYRPAYLPPGMSILMAANSNRVSEPLIFVLPEAVPPESYPSSSRQPLVHPNGVGRITGLTLTTTAGPDLSPELQTLVEVGAVDVDRGLDPHLLVEFDRRRKDAMIDFRPTLPLSFRW